MAGDGGRFGRHPAARQLQLFGDSLIEGIPHSLHIARDKRHGCVLDAALGILLSVHNSDRNILTGRIHHSNRAHAGLGEADTNLGDVGSRPPETVEHDDGNSFTGSRARGAGVDSRGNGAQVRFHHFIAETFRKLVTSDRVGVDLIHHRA